MMPEFAFAGAHGALAGHPHVGAEVPFTRHVVVVAVHGVLLELELRQVVAKRAQGALHHHLAVGARVVLRPADRRHVVVEQFFAFHEEGEVLVRHVVAEFAAQQFFPGTLDEVLADCVARAA